jgi:hypothetical protein
VRIGIARALPSVLPPAFTALPMKRRRTCSSPVCRSTSARCSQAAGRTDANDRDRRVARIETRRAIRHIALFAPAPPHAGMG